MKNRFTAIILICALLLVGCGSEGQSVNDSASGAEPEVEEAVDSAEESGEGAQALYEKFLNNEVPVTIDSHVDRAHILRFRIMTAMSTHLKSLLISSLLIISVRMILLRYGWIKLNMPTLIAGLTASLN